MTGSDDHIVTTTRDRHTSPASGSAAVASLLPSQRSSLHRDVNGSRFIVLMKVYFPLLPPLLAVSLTIGSQGVSGTGKSTLGAALSEALHLPFIDGDDLHPVANVAKMSRGEPLEDADRQPWLETIRQTAVARVLDQVGVERPGVAKPHADSDERLTAYESSMIRVGKRRDEAWRPGLIAACSALKKTYRAVLRGEVSSLQSRPGSMSISLPTYFVYLKGDREVLMARMVDRKGHFMKASMLESQLNTLESPEDEPGVVTVSVEMSTEEQVRRVVDTFRSWES